MKKEKWIIGSRIYWTTEVLEQWQLHVIKVHGIIIIVHEWLVGELITCNNMQTIGSRNEQARKERVTKVQTRKTIQDLYKNANNYYRINKHI
jgi:hypothetical protein